MTTPPTPRPYRQRLNAERLFIGCAIIGFTLFGVRFCQSHHNDTLQEALETPRITVETVQSINVGDQVIVEGDIAKETLPLIEDLVVACEEEYYNFGDEHYWETLKTYPNTLNLAISPELSSRVIINHPCDLEGYKRRLLEPRPGAPAAVGRRRAIGYVAGQHIMVMGTVYKTRPLELEATYARAGTYDRYLKSMKSNGLMIKILAGVLLFIGAVIAFTPQAEDQNTPTPQPPVPPQV